LQLKREHERHNISTYKPKHFSGPCVINLSKKELTKEQKEIFEKGIKFGLNPKKSSERRNNFKDLDRDLCIFK